MSPYANPAAKVAHDAAYAKAHPEERRARYHANREKIEARRKELMTPERRAAKAAYDAAHKRTPRGRASQRRATKNQYVTRPLQWSARQAVHRALKVGELVREPCLVCGDPKAEAHHFLGYAAIHWLDVEWLCRAHHRAAHAEVAA